MDYNEEDRDLGQYGEEDLSSLNSSETNDELANENTPTPDDNGSNPREFNRNIKNPKAKAKKGILDFIMAHKAITFSTLGVLGGLGFIAILIFQLNFDLVGIGNTKPSYYTETPSCGKVFLTWETEAYYNAHKNDSNYTTITDPSLVDLNYVDSNNVKRWEHNEYDYDTYITGIVWYDNNEAKDVDNEIVYQAMAVSARSRLIATLPDNCVVLKDYNDQAKSFVELNGTEEKYSEISQAVSSTAVLIIGRNNKAIEALYDTFSYTKKIQENDANFDSNYFYHMMNENEENHQVIPAKWVDDLEKVKGKIKTKVLSTKKLESMSLYGAKYLQEHIDYDFNLYRILENYYGRDIEYYTIDYNSSNKKPIAGPIADGCYVWPIGSVDTTIENGVEIALGAPETITITSNFGNRNTGIAGASTNHKGIDIAGGRGRGATNIIAMASGIVTEVKTGCVTSDYSCGSKYGNHVVIDHGNGISTRYAHMYSVNVSVGQKVEKGQILGKMGNTGNVGSKDGKPTHANDVRGTHLHFEVMNHNNRVDPLNYVSKTAPRPTECGVTPAPSQSPIGGGSAKETICLAFKQAGYTSAQTVGAMVNADRETGGTWNPNAFNPSGGGQGAYGLFQWRGDRQKALKGFKNYDTAEVQVAFALSELASSEGRARIKLIEATTPNEASYAFCKYFERPGSDNICVSRQNYKENATYYNYANNGCK